MKKITAALLLTAMLASLAASASAAEIGYDFEKHVSKSGEPLFRIEYTDLEETDEDTEEEEESEETDDSGYNLTVYKPVVAEPALVSSVKNTYTYTASIDTAKNVSELTFDLEFHVNTEKEEEDDGIIYAWITDCTGEEDCICRQCLEERKTCTCDDCNPDSGELTVWSQIDIAVYGSKDTEYGWERITVTSASVENGTAVLKLDTGCSYTDYKVVIYTDGQAEIDNLQFTKTLTFRHTGDTVPDVMLSRFAKYFEE